MVEDGPTDSLLLLAANPIAVNDCMNYLVISDQFGSYERAQIDLHFLKVFCQHGNPLERDLRQSARIAKSTLNSVTFSRLFLPLK